MPRLPIHGFVLAGGLSRRMGTDKATLPLGGRPLVQIAAEKLRTFCSGVSIAGNRNDLGGFAPVVHEAVAGLGPLAGVEAGLKACPEPWALFVPVDVPMVPGALLRRWASAVLRRQESAVGFDRKTDSLYGSALIAGGRAQPAFLLLQRDVAPALSALIEGGERRLEAAFDGLALAGVAGAMVWDDAAAFAPEALPTSLELERWFSNVNTPQDFARAERWAETAERAGSILKGRAL